MLEYALIGLIIFLFLLCALLLRALYLSAAQPLHQLALADATDLVFPFVESGRAREAAEQRRRFILSQEQDVALEVFENPPLLEGASLSLSARELSRSEASAQLATLKWQMKDDAFLLLGRVIDLVTVISRSAEDGIRTTVHEIKLRKASRRELGRNLRDLFPFHVVLAIDNPEFWIEQLRPYQNWLSIGVSVQSPREIETFGRCKAPGGLDGKAGGFLKISNKPFQMTCSHVISNQCRSVIFRSNLKKETLEPDVAILTENPCFPSEFQGTRVTPIDDDRAFYLRESEFIRVPGKHRSGIFHEIVGWVTYEGRTHKFPHARIRPNINIVLDLFNWPPWVKNFSTKGDSGSWIIQSSSEEWLGILVAGNRSTHESYVALAKPLMDFVIASMNLSSDTEAYLEN